MHEYMRVKTFYYIGDQRRHNQYPAGLKHLNYNSVLEMKRDTSKISPFEGPLVKNRRPEANNWIVRLGKMAEMEGRS